MSALACVLLCAVFALVVVAILGGGWLYHWRYPQGYVPRAVQSDESLVASDDDVMANVPVWTRLQNDIAERERKAFAEKYVYANEREGRVN